MNKTWICKGISMMAAIGAVICSGSHKIEAVIFSAIGDKCKKDKSK